MVDVRPVNNQEAVVALLVGMYRYRGILAVMLLQVQLQLVADGLRVDIGRYAGVPLAALRYGHLLFELSQILRQLTCPPIPLSRHCSHACLLS